jgi:hypothetical protein
LKNKTRPLPSLPYHISLLWSFGHSRLHLSYWHCYMGHKNNSWSQKKGGNRQFVYNSVCRYTTASVSCRVGEHLETLVIVVTRTKRKVVLLSCKSANFNHTYYCGITERYCCKIPSKEHHWILERAQKNLVLERMLWGIGIPLPSISEQGVVFFGKRYEKVRFYSFIILRLFR